MPKIIAWHSCSLSVIFIRLHEDSTGVGGSVLGVVTELDNHSADDYCGSIY